MALIIDNATRLGRKNAFANVLEVPLPSKASQPKHHPKAPPKHRAPHASLHKCFPQNTAPKHTPSNSTPKKTSKPKHHPKAPPKHRAPHASLHKCFPQNTAPSSSYPPQSPLLSSILLPSPQAKRDCKTPPTLKISSPRVSPQEPPPNTPPANTLQSIYSRIPATAPPKKHPNQNITPRPPKTPRPTRIPPQMLPLNSILPPPPLKPHKSPLCPQAFSPLPRRRGNVKHHPPLKSHPQGFLLKNRPQTHPSNSTPKKTSKPKHHPKAPQNTAPHTHPSTNASPQQHPTPSSS